MKKVAFIMLACSLFLSGRQYSLPEQSFTVSFEEPELTIYKIASELTGCPESILRGIAFAESSFNPDAVGDDGCSVGMFQINERFRDERIEKYGEYNPYCPLDSAILTGRLYMENLERLGSPELAIAAHRQGVVGVRKNGASAWYVERVMSKC